MSDQVPIPDPLHPAVPRSAAPELSGPVPGRPDLNLNQQPPSLERPDPNAPPAPGRLTAAPDADAGPTPDPDPPPQLPRLQTPRRGRRLVPKPAAPTAPLTPQQRLLLLDTWQRSGLPAADFAALVGLSKDPCSQYPSCHSLAGPRLWESPATRARSSWSFSRSA